MKAKVIDLIPEGYNNAVTAEELSRLTGVSHRNIFSQIERYRRKGAMICANVTDEPRGYYKAENIAEFLRYTRLYKRRLNQGIKTYKAMILTAKQEKIKNANANK